MKLFKRLLQIQLSKTAKTIIAASMALFLSWLMFFHWTGTHEVSIMRNFVTGEMTIDSVPGPGISAPWVQVSTIDTRPQRLCIDCDCRALNCKLVEFVPSEWKTFVDREGFRYYWLSNRISFNSGSEHTYRGMDWILRGYAFDSEIPPFIRVTKE